MTGFTSCDSENVLNAFVTVAVCPWKMCFYRCLRFCFTNFGLQVRLLVVTRVLPKRSFCFKRFFVFVTMCKIRKILLGFQCRNIKLQRLVISICSSRGSSLTVNDMLHLKYDTDFHF